MRKQPRRLPVSGDSLAARAPSPPGGGAHLPALDEAPEGPEGLPLLAEHEREAPAEYPEGLDPRLVDAAGRVLSAEAAPEDLAGDPLALDVLDELPAGHPHRAGLVASLLWKDPEGRYRHVARDWTHELPTVARVCALVGAGILPDGSYLVQLRRGRATAPPIRFSALRPVTPGAPAAGQADQALVGRLLDSLLARHGGDERQVLVELASKIDRLSERIEAVERLAADALPALAEGGERKGVGGALIESLAGGLAQKLLGPAQPAAAPAGAGAAGAAGAGWTR